MPHGDNVLIEDSKAIIHQDLSDAFNALTEHLGRLTMQYLKNSDEIDFANISIDGFKFTGSTDYEAVVITGSRHLEESKKYINLVSPALMTVSQNDTYDYPYFEELWEALLRCVDETKKYIIDGKHAPDLNPTLFDSDTENDISISIRKDDGETVKISKKKGKRAKVEVDQETHLNEPDSDF